MDFDDVYELIDECELCEKELYCESHEVDCDGIHPIFEECNCEESKK